jgi:hypothetical protein
MPQALSVLKSHFNRTCIGNCKYFANEDSFERSICKKDLASRTRRQPTRPTPGWAEAGRGGGAGVGGPERAGAGGRWCRRGRGVGPGAGAGAGFQVPAPIQCYTRIGAG